MIQRRNKRRSTIANIDALRSILRLLGSDVRCNMLIDLATKPADVSALAARLRCTPSTVRRNLQRLAEEMLVTLEQAKDRSLYRLSDIVSVQRTGDMVDLHVGLPCGGKVALRLLRPIDGSA